MLVSRQTFIFVTLVAMLIAQPPLRAQQDRLRSLKYDPKQKDWVEEAPPTPGTPEGELYAIRLLVKAEEFGKALTALKKFTKKHGEGHELYPEALLLKAQVYVGQEEYEKAHETNQVFLAEFGGMALTDEALRLEFVTAEAFLAGHKKHIWGIIPVSAEDLGYEILDQIATDYPDSQMAPLAIKAKGDDMFRKGSHDLAELEYARLLRDYPQSRYHQYALSRTAESALASFGGVEYDEAALIEAEERYREYRAAYPGAAEQEGVGLILDTLKEMRAEKDLSIGQYYERTEHLGSAIFYYRIVVNEWPQSIAAVKAAERLELLGAAPIGPAAPVPAGSDEPPLPAGP
jgi:outer membrane protein assembly factor BamD (BamD/ComL family)